MKSKELATRGARSALERQDASAIAPRWHTAALVALIVAVAVTGSLLGARGVSPASPSPGAAGTPGPGTRLLVLYAPLVVVEWSLAFYVCRVGRPRSALAALLGRGWRTLREALVDVALAAEGWLLVHAFEVAVVYLHGARTPAAVASMLPSTWLERLAWVVVSISAGFCEELVYRGYLQRQLAAFTRRPALALALQAILFGVAHAEQGLGSAARLAVYGLGLGALARWRRSLWPGIVCHVAIDLTSGFLGA
jgi:membrane protease YdiL (CAAX protease family)